MLSFVVPVYKTPEKLLRSCLDSILEYSKPMELVCVLDSPGDFCEQILDEYSKKDNRVRVFKNDHNFGVSYSRNRGMNAARGTYIAFVDADDEIVATTYERGFNVIDQNGFGGVVFSSSEKQVERYGARYGEMISGTIHSDKALILVMVYFMAVFPMILRREVLTKLGIVFKVGHRFGEDYMFITQVLLTGCEFSFLNMFGYKYIGHPKSACRDTPCCDRYLQGLIAVLKVLSESLDKSVDEHVIRWHIANGLPMVLFDRRARKYVKGRERKKYLQVLVAYFEVLLSRCYNYLRFPFRAIISIVRIFPGVWFCPFMPASQALRFLSHFHLMLTREEQCNL